MDAAVLDGLPVRGRKDQSPARIRGGITPSERTSTPARSRVHGSVSEVTGHKATTRKTDSND